MVDVYTDIGLNNQLQATTSPIVRQKRTAAYDFDWQYEVKNREIKASKMNVENLVKSSGVSSGTASFAAGTSLIVQITTTFNGKNLNKPMFGIDYVAFYEGASIGESTQIYPYRGTSVAGTYNIQFDYDWQSWNGNIFANGPPKMVKRGVVERLGGTAAVQLTVLVETIFIDYTSGAAVMS